MEFAPREGLLPGEQPDTGYPEDAEHWLTVYSELLQFATDLGLGSYAGHYRRRIRFWRARRRQLGSSEQS